MRSAANTLRSVSGIFERPACGVLRRTLSDCFVGIMYVHLHTDRSLSRLIDRQASPICSMRCP